MFLKILRNTYLATRTAGVAYGPLQVVVRGDVLVQVVRASHQRIGDCAYVIVHLWQPIMLGALAMLLSERRSQLPLVELQQFFFKSASSDMSEAMPSMFRAMCKEIIPLCNEYFSSEFLFDTVFSSKPTGR